VLLVVRKLSVEGLMYEREIIQVELKVGQQEDLCRLKSLVLKTCVGKK